MLHETCILRSPVQCGQQATVTLISNAFELNLFDDSDGNRQHRV
jgi:hypothetical protein